MLGAAEAVPAVARLTAAIPAAPIAVFIVVVVNFTMGSFLVACFPSANSQWRREPAGLK
jgi:hypothetical protein